MNLLFGMRQPFLYFQPFQNGMVATSSFFAKQAPRDKSLYSIVEGSVICVNSSCLTVTQNDGYVLDFTHSSLPRIPLGAEYWVRSRKITAGGGILGKDELVEYSTFFKVSGM